MAKTADRVARRYSSPIRQEQAQITRARIVEAAAGLFVERGYRGVTMEDIAAEAGVAPQTVYATFGTKLAVAQKIIWTSFEAEGIPDLLAQARGAGELSGLLDVGARIARRLNERFAVIAQFMRESGEPALLAEYQKIEDLRFEQIEREVGPALRSNQQLRRDVTPHDALTTVWALTGTDLYYQLVIRRRWTPSRYAVWLRDVLRRTLLLPSVNK